MGGWRGRSGARRPGADRQAPVPRAWRTAPSPGQTSPCSRVRTPPPLRVRHPANRQRRARGGVGPRWVAGAVGAELRDQERTDKPPSRVRGARPHPTTGASMPLRSHSTAAARATSRQPPTTRAGGGGSALGGWRGRSGAQRPGADRQAPVPRAWRTAPSPGRRLPVAAFALHRRCACDIPPTANDARGGGWVRVGWLARQERSSETRSGQTSP